MNQPTAKDEEVAAAQSTVGQGIAIIGMSCLFPKAADLDAFWSNILGKVDAVTDPPPEAWDPNIYYDPASSESDRIYCKRGGFLGDLVHFDPLAHGIPPMSVGGEPDQWLALDLARKALDDAGYPEPEEAVRHRTAVILGRGATFNGGTAISVQHSLVVAQTMQIIEQLHPDYTPAELEEIRAGLKSNLPKMAPEIMPGLVPNIVAGRIANRLDLMGPSYTIDAACASSLVALQMAVRDLVNGDCDLALAGGSHVWTPMPMLAVFTQLNALSRNQQIRPFDKDADGTVLGEGLGMLVLKRLEEAECDNDRIYAVIRGVGVASDGRAMGVMAPRIEGEELAMRRAYEAAGVSPSSVELIEAHGTGTLVGDLTEIQSMTRVFGLRRGPLPSIALGTVKSMISHTVPAAGVAGIIKTALALHHKMLPPTLHCDEPNPKFELEKTPLYINTESRPWIHGDEVPRRAGVSAFGFGGINAHVVLEEHVPASTAGFELQRPDLPDHRPAWDSEVCLLRAVSQAELHQRALDLQRYTTAVLASLDTTVRLEDVAYSLALDFAAQPAESRHTLAIVATSLADLDEKLARAAQRLADPECRQIQERAGVYYTAAPLAPEGKVAFLFPGEGSQYINMLADLCLHFPAVRDAFDASDRIFRDSGHEHLLSDVVFPRPTFSKDEKAWAERQLFDMNVAPAAVLAADAAILTILEGLGVRPDMLLGHSSGEWAALQAAGVFGTSAAERREWIARDLFTLFEETIANDNIPDAALLAIGADRAAVEALLSKVGGGVRIAMDNCPHQVVVATPLDAVERVLEAARAEGLVVERLAFDRPYHTPEFAAYSKRLLGTLEGLNLQTTQLPIFSAASVGPFPADVAGVRELTSGQWTREVQFARTIEKLYDEGARIFVEVGPRSSLTSFVEDTLRKRPICAVSANEQRRSGITQLNHLVGRLATQGVPLDLAYLYRWRNPHSLDLAAAPPERNRASTMLLKTQFPAMRVPSELAERLVARAPRSVYAPSPPPIAEAPVPPTHGAQPARIAVAAEAPLTQATPFESAPAPTPLAAPPAPGVTAAYFETMQQFLNVQERVMGEYLAGASRAAATTAPVSPPIDRVGPPPASASSAAPAMASATASDSRPTVVAAETHDLPASPPAASMALAAAPEAAPPAPLSLEQLLLEIVSERTGYPIEVIDVESDLEADLGIDSIKRVEIMGTFRQRATADVKFAVEELITERTLRGVINLVEASERAGD